MKSFFTLLLTLVGMISANAQQYVSFPFSNVKWNVYYRGTCSETTPADTIVFTYQYYGDTVVSGVNYHQLGVTSNTSATPVIIGLMREENKKVYYTAINLAHELGKMAANKETLLYDFNATAGSLIVHDSSYTGSPVYTSTVQSIDSVLIGGAYRKRYNMGNARFAQGTEYWVEGIGSMTDGLISKITLTPTCGTWYWENVCFTENDTRIYLNPDYLDCNASKPVLSVSEMNKGALIKIFPNPAIGKEIYINGLEPADGVQLKLIDYTGRVLMTTSLKERNNKVTVSAQVPFCILILTDKQGRTIRSQKITFQ